MLGYSDNDGCMRSIPVPTAQTECEGYIWFFMNIKSEKAKILEGQKCVNVSYSDNKEETFVSITGKAEIINDRNKISELWKPNMKEWIPLEANDPDLVLLKVNVEDAESWDNSDLAMKQIWIVDHEHVN